MPRTPAKKAGTPKKNNTTTPSKKTATPSKKATTPAKKSATPIKKAVTAEDALKLLTLYQILRIQLNATPGRIFAAYQASLADMAENGASDKERAAVMKAYQVLSDPNQRKKYDEKIAAEKAKKSATTGAAKAKKTPTKAMKKSKTVDSDDEFSDYVMEDGPLSDGEQTTADEDEDNDSSVRSEETGGKYVVAVTRTYSLDEHEKICGCDFEEGSECKKMYAED